ncbi:MAG: OsmC family protein [Alkalispirochaetaceae bacterium]
MEERYTYTAQVSWIGEKKGVTVADALPQIDVATPPEFGGHQGRWSPEHLLVSSLGSCIMTTFLAIAEASKFEFTSYESKVTGTIERIEKSYEFTHLEVTVHLGVSEESAVQKGERLLQKAEENCFISNSLKAKVELLPEVTVV